MCWTACAADFVKTKINIVLVTILVTKMTRMVFCKNTCFIGFFRILFTVPVILVTKFEENDEDGYFVNEEVNKKTSKPISLLVKK